jgi:hypothetical protein
VLDEAARLEQEFPLRPDEALSLLGCFADPPAGISTWSLARGLLEARRPRYLLGPNYPSETFHGTPTAPHSRFAPTSRRTWIRP